MSPAVSRQSPNNRCANRKIVCATGRAFGKRFVKTDTSTAFRVVFYKRQWHVPDLARS